jgi:hypothetical protein
LAESIPRLITHIAKQKLQKWKLLQRKELQPKAEVWRATLYVHIRTIYFEAVGANSIRALLKQRTHTPPFAPAKLPCSPSQKARLHELQYLAVSRTRRNISLQIRQGTQASSSMIFV